MGWQLVAAVAVVEEVQVDIAAAVLPQCGGKALGVASQAGALVDGRSSVKNDA